MRKLVHSRYIKVLILKVLLTCVRPYVGVITCGVHRGGEKEDGHDAQEEGVDGEGGSLHGPSYRWFQC